MTVYKPCHNNNTHVFTSQTLYFVTQYEHWPVQEYFFCPDCIKWGLAHRPDLYHQTHESALAESIARNLGNERSIL